MSSSVLQPKLTNNEVAPLIAKLDDLESAPATVVQIVQCGAAAVPFLAYELIHGKRRSLPQPRCSLVEALTLLGANDVLLEYLKTTRPSDDLEIRFAEDIVIGSAARAIKLHFSAEAYCVLFTLAQERSSPGVLEALALYRREESIPCFIRALESDLSRTTAVTALEQFGQAAKPYVLAAALAAEPAPPDHESTSSLYRRRACLKLLERLALNPEDVDRLLPALSEPDAQIVISAATLVLQYPTHERLSVAIARLESLRAHIDWLLKDESDTLLAQLDEAFHWS